MSERNCDVVVIGAGPAGEVAPGGWPTPAWRSHRRGALGRRRMLLLRLHALEGAAAPRPGAGGGRARPGHRRGGRRRLDVAGGARAPRRGDPPPRRRGSCHGWSSAGSTLVRGQGGSRRARASRVGDEDAGGAAGDRASPPARGAAVPPIAGCTRRGRGPTARRRPRRRCRRALVVLGGGAVGVELAQAYASLGTERDDARGARAAAARARSHSPASTCASRCAASASRSGSAAPGRRPSRGATAAVSVELDDGASARRRRAARGGRARPRTCRRLGLETVGVEPGRSDRGRRHAARARPRMAVRRSATPTAACCYPHGQVPGAGSPRIASSAARSRCASTARSPARDLHRAAGRRRRPHARQRAGGRHRRPRRRRRHRRQRRRQASSAPARPAPRGSSSTSSAA